MTDAVLVLCGGLFVLFTVAFIVSLYDPASWTTNRRKLPREEAMLSWCINTAIWTACALSLAILVFLLMALSRGTT